jgi:hypothetical protein
VLGDPYANEVMRETAKFLGAGVANIINVLNPEMVVIAGGVTRAGDHLFVPLRAEVRKRAFKSAQEACQIVSAQLPGHGRRDRRHRRVQEGDLRRLKQLMRLGVIGTMVWDRIHSRDGRAQPIEEWGGISYALAAASAARPGRHDLVPIIKVGATSRSGVPLPAQPARPRPRHRRVRVVPEPNNRVELRYHDRDRRCERLTGGVGPWTWPELEPMVRDRRALHQLHLRLRARARDRAGAARDSMDPSTPTCTRSCSASARRPAHAAAAGRVARVAALLRRRSGERGRAGHACACLGRSVALRRRCRGRGAAPAVRDAGRTRRRVRRLRRHSPTTRSACAPMP